MTPSVKGTIVIPWMKTFLITHQLKHTLEIISVLWPVMMDDRNAFPHAS